MTYIVQVVCLILFVLTLLWSVNDAKKSEMIHYNPIFKVQQ